MGVEAAAATGAVIGGAGALLGAAESRKAGKRARMEAESARQDAEESKSLAKAEKMRLSDIEKDARAKVDKNRKRLRGGLFGEEQEAKTTLG